MNNSTSLDTLSSLISAHTVSRCIYILAEAGVADLLESEPRPVADLAVESGLDSDALERILRLVSGYGLFIAEGAGYMHTSMSKLLCSDHPQSLRPFARMTGMPVIWKSITELPHSARTGTPASNWSDLLAHFSKNPQDACLFNASMASKSRMAIKAVTEAYDFSSFNTIADIGGGRGHLLQAVCSGLSAKGILFELPHVIADAIGIASPKLQLVEGDFFSDSLPVADVYMLMAVLHDWNDEQAVEILSAIRRSAPACARVLIIESMIINSREPHSGNLFDVMMLALTGGRKRSKAAFERLLDRSGFRMERVIDTGSQYAIVEAFTV
ncbi:methyltransferase [Microbulbifer litoralis]|uniref:methyltransferase n=1 Tax=Microbulbifer litoralis TaxID=2933965 RepID=UPI0020276E8F|nr:methyltransferase [Microbulbifer sp. GX H0434]